MNSISTENSNNYNHSSNNNYNNININNTKTSCSNNKATKTAPMWRRLLRGSPPPPRPHVLGGCMWNEMDEFTPVSEFPNQTSALSLGILMTTYAHNSNNNGNNSSGDKNERPKISLNIKLFKLSWQFPCSRLLWVVSR